MLASIYSIYLNSELGKINLHIIYDDFSIDNILYIEKFLGNLDNVNFHFYYLDDRDIDKYHIPKWRKSHIANAKLFFQSILKDNIPNKLLYIDADTICVGDLKCLEEYNRYPIYAAKDSMRQCYFQRFGDLEKYFNSGILYIDTDKWEDIKAENCIVDFMHNNPYKLLYPDQDILNNVLSHNIGELSIEYNLPPHAYIFDDNNMRRYYTHKSITPDEIFTARENAKICHSYGLSGIKPWSNNKINPYNDLFMEYLYMVNPHFKKEELGFLKRLYASNKKIFYTILLWNSDLSSITLNTDKHTLNKSIQN